MSFRGKSVASDGTKSVHVAIIGAGIGGISTAINLKRQLGFSNFIIFEKAQEIGGTWRDNTYPGCSCDVPVHWYSLSSELNPDWSHFCAKQPEILAYWQSLAAKYQLYAHIAFGARVASLTWENSTQTWKVQFIRSGHGNEASKRVTIRVQLVVSAVGGFAAPGYSNLEGRDVFRGEMFHSAGWDHSVNLSGKRVGVIGNGCSATQIIPMISKDPSVKVINFCRTPSWIAPKIQFPYPAVAKWIFRYIPLIARVHRIILVALSDPGYILWDRKSIVFRKLEEWQFLVYMWFAAPKKHRKKLTPHYPLGCKRVIVDSGYYASLHRPNVELEWGGVKEIVKDGLVTGDGKKHELDVIIYATGFVQTHSAKSNVKIIGKGTRTMDEYFESRGGAEAYVGTTIPGFPNYFTIFGPNVGSGHASDLFSEEQQIQYALQLMRPVIEGKALSFEVRREVSHAYNANLQRRLGKTTWVRCQSYYRNASGKVVATFPGPIVWFWYLTRSVNWSDYIAVGADEWNRELRARFRMWRDLALGLLAALLMFAWRSGMTMGK